ncbi:MAG: hypothetical protein BBJ60_11615 [Desulfobacterales bacterium S7086C20]|nr:MAG: hypothetical protein BBJ60_11615 [Desulfobacterales bacterium S7086C20]
MKNILRMILVVMIGFALSMNMGCAAKVKHSGFLKDYPEFEQGPAGGVDLIYLKEGVDFKKYDKVMMDFVQFWFKDGTEYKGIHIHELNELAAAFNKAMADALKDAYPMVDDPGPDVLRIRFAITDVIPSRPALNTITAVTPVGLALSTVKKGVTGTHTFVGEASMEAELLDSLTNERLGAAIDRKAAGKYKIVKGMTKWGHAKDAFGFWAKRLRKWLDEVHGK